MAVQEQPFEAIAETMKRAGGALREAQVPFLLGGSLAFWAHGGAEKRKDLDFMIRREDAERALEVLGELGMRTEKPPEGWLYKAWDGDVLVDLIFYAKGMPITDEVIARGQDMDVLAMPLRVMALEDVLTSMLLAMDEHNADYSKVLEMTRALREKIDWDEVRERTSHSPFARAFFTLAEGIEIVAPTDRPSAAENGEGVRVRVVPQAEAGL